MANALIYAERCLLIIIGLTSRSKNSAEIGLPLQNAAARFKGTVSPVQNWLKSGINKQEMVRHQALTI